MMCLADYPFVKEEAVLVTPGRGHSPTSLPASLIVCLCLGANIRLSRARCPSAEHTHSLGPGTPLPEPRPPTAVCAGLWTQPHTALPGNFNPGQEETKIEREPEAHGGACVRRGRRPTRYPTEPGRHVHSDTNPEAEDVPLWRHDGPRFGDRGVPLLWAEPLRARGTL